MERAPDPVDAEQTCWGSPFLVLYPPSSFGDWPCRFRTVVSQSEVMMKYMVTWTIPTHSYDAAVEAFLNGGAPMPAGLKLLGRWHAPGSKKGWLLCETDDPGILYEHMVEWGSMLESEVFPVISDAEAAAAATRAREK
jgi:hypothetical protein